MDAAATLHTIGLALMDAGSAKHHNLRLVVLALPSMH